MANCKDCVHAEVCRFKDLPAPLSDSYIRESECIEKRCGNFKDRARFVELPFAISEGSKLYYIFEDIDEKIKVGKNREMVTRVCKDGFYVSGDLHCNGTYSDDDYFYPWSAIGTEYFFTFEEAEAALKEREGQ